MVQYQFIIQRHDIGLVPPSVYINAADFNDVKELINFCLNLSDKEKQKIVNNGYNWLTSGAASRFDTGHQASTIIDAVNYILCSYPSPEFKLSSANLTGGDYDEFKW